MNERGDIDDVKRLLDEGDLGALLLASAIADGPSRPARERLAQGLLARARAWG
jgi:hypothetical protein